MTRLLTLITLFVALSGCLLSPLPEEDETRQDVWTTTGRIDTIKVDCGGWGLRTEDELYELVGLPDDFKVDELPVRTKVKRRRDLASCTMAGPIIEVLEMERE